MLHIIKNAEVLEILLFLHTNKLVCHSFISAGRLHKNPGSENDCLSLIPVAS